MTGQESLRHALVFTCLLTLLVASLGTLVSLMRMRKKVYLGDGGDKQLANAIRAHGNAAEHVPFLIILLLILGMIDADPTAVLVLGATALFARCIHAGGRLGKKRQFSVAGATITYLLEFGIPVWILVIVSGS